jgi:hypothetical protein
MRLASSLYEDANPYYFDAVLPEENVIGRPPCSVAFVSNFDIGAFLDSGGSVKTQQAPFGLLSTFQQPLLFWDEVNVIEGQPWPALFEPDLDVGDPIAFSGSVEIQQAPFDLLSASQQPLPPPPSFPCAEFGCTKTFRRASDRVRHQNTVHSARQGRYLCQVPGCPMSHGAGYSRADKVTEHLWKKHADMGYTKRA